MRPPSSTRRAIAALLLVTSCGDAGAGPDTATAGASTGTSSTDPSTTGDPPTTGGKADMPLEPTTLVVAVLSSRPDMVTGGDALIEVRFADVTAGTITVRAGDVDVTAAFQPIGDDRLLGLVEGLELGDTAIEASAPGQTPATLVVTNYPIEGPMISGPHQAPFACRTVDSGLGEPLDADCSVATRYEYFYKNTLGEFFLLPDPAQVPGNVQQVETSSGAMIDYVVRVERGTINRSVYQITTLYDPTAPEWTALSPQPQWTGKVLYNFRGGCGEGHHQGALGPTDDLGGQVMLLNDAPVAGGFAVLSASLNTLGVTCNDVLTAETAMMVKERFIERYGVPLYTTGWGGSGGSIQQHTLAENYPGVLDGIVPAISYPDVFSIYPDVMDCPLLLYYFLANAEGNFNDVADQAAVAGFANEQTCSQWFGPFGHFEDPTKGCDASVPADQIYHPIDNPDGVRCTFVDNVTNLLGADPNTGHARKIFDNVGVQYGLSALNEGLISKEQFLHLNEQIGGYGKDGAPVPTRTAADPAGLRAAYEGGRVVRGDLGLASTPIVDLRIYTDLLGDIHDRVRTSSTRDRLIRANGHADNHAAIIGTVDASAQLGVTALLAIDAWLVALAAADQTDLPAAVVATRPPWLTDLCLLAPNTDPTPGACEVELPVHGTPRMVAGAPRVNDTLKCTLKPIDLDDYTVTFTDVELARLEQAFPDGVCDWDAPGVEQVPALGTWQSFGPKP
jgi:hypothetical protein